MLTIKVKRNYLFVKCIDLLSKMQHSLIDFIQNSDLIISSSRHCVHCVLILLTVLLENLLFVEHNKSFSFRTGRISSLTQFSVPPAVLCVG